MAVGVGCVGCGGFVCLVFGVWCLVIGVWDFFFWFRVVVIGV